VAIVQRSSKQALFCPFLYFQLTLWLISLKKKLLLPTITDLKSAQAAARQGTAVCIVIMIFSSAMVAISTATGSGRPSQEFIFMMLIYGLIAYLTTNVQSCCSFRTGDLLRRSLSFDCQKWCNANFTLAIFFIFAFINSIRGTFAYHRLRHLRAEAIEESQHN
jgi:hypothetical protein